jgi:hypothetical protein
MNAVLKHSLLVSALLFSACNDEPPEPPCDVTDGDCQEALFALTAKVRGQEGAKKPPIRVISRKQLRDEIQASLDQSTDPEPDDVAVQQAFALLHLLPASAGAADEAFADDLAEGVAAYYGSGSKSITVISDSAGSDEDGTFVLAHEFTHALQDQRGELDAPQGFDTTDAQVAFDSLVEGEAVWISNLVMARTADASLSGAVVEQYFDKMEANMLDSVADSEAPLYLAGEILPYPLGGRGVYHAYADADLPGIQKLHDMPPDNVGFWLNEEPARAKLTCAPPTAPAGYEELASDRLGVTGMVALDAALTGAVPRIDLANAWVDDGVTLFADKARKKLGLAYRIRFLTATDALLLADRVLESKLLETTLVDARANQSEVLVLAANDQGLLDALKASDACPAPKSAAGVRQKLLASWRRQHLR